MKLHHRVIHHIHAHVSKHHKKYLFGAGVAFGMGILKILAITGIFLGISLSTGKSNAANESIKMYNNIAIFSKIDDIAHEEMNESPEENTFSTQELKDRFYKIDTAFHNANNINEEYRAQKEMIDLLEEAEESRPQVTGEKETDLAKDDEYRALIEEFKALR